MGRKASTQTVTGYKIRGRGSVPQRGALQGHSCVRVGRATTTGREARSRALEPSLRRAVSIAVCIRRPQPSSAHETITAHLGSIAPGRLIAEVSAAVARWRACAECFVIAIYRASAQVCVAVIRYGIIFDGTSICVGHVDNLRPGTTKTHRKTVGVAIGARCWRR